MNDQTNFTLSVNRKTGELQVQREKLPDNQSVGHELSRFTEQIHKSKHLVLILIMALLGTFLVLSLSKDDIRMINSLIYLAVFLITGYIGVNYIDYLNIRYVMDTIRKIYHKPTEEQNRSDQNNEDLMFDKKKKKNGLN